MGGVSSCGQGWGLGLLVIGWRLGLGLWAGLGLAVRGGQAECLNFVGIWELVPQTFKNIFYIMYQLTHLNNSLWIS